MTVSSASTGSFVLGLAPRSVPLMTSPAMIRRLACSRDSHSPLATKRTSTRSRTAMSFPYLAALIEAASPLVFTASIS